LANRGGKCANAARPLDMPPPAPRVNAIYPAEFVKAALLPLPRSVRAQQDARTSSHKTVFAEHETTDHAEIRPRGSLEIGQPRSIFRELAGGRDTNDTVATRAGNMRNRAKKFDAIRSHAVHAFGDFRRCLVISY
jgi:hypothetical protein